MERVMGKGDFNFLVQVLIAQDSCPLKYFWDCTWIIQVEWRHFLWFTELMSREMGYCLFTFDEQEDVASFCWVDCRAICTGPWKWPIRVVILSLSLPLSLHSLLLAIYLSASYSKHQWMQNFFFLRHWPAAHFYMVHSPGRLIVPDGFLVPVSAHCTLYILPDTSFRARQTSVYRWTERCGNRVERQQNDTFHNLSKRKSFPCCCGMSTFIWSIRFFQELLAFFTFVWTFTCLFGFSFPASF